jgi:N-carbamoyl-L-amino-acid hydrolase
MSAETTPSTSAPGLTNTAIDIKPGTGAVIDSVNSARLWDRLNRLGEIGAFNDERTKSIGVCRLALTDKDAEGRLLVEQWMLDQGLTVTRDAIGNVYGRREGRNPELAPVMIGSHIDSVATAGRFDGCLGVVGGLEVFATLDDHGIVTERPLVTAFFTDEEGVRFGTDMLGSATAVGRLDLDWALSRTDRDGVSVAQELERHNITGEAAMLEASPPHAYFECHIEQGPVLLHNDKALGVVTGVQGISWWKIRIGGAAAHAGCTPMNARRDAGLALSNLRAAMHRLTDEIPGLLCNFGLLSTTPGLTNVVPDTATATIDLRNPDEKALQQAEERMHALIEEHISVAGCELISLDQTARTAPVDFHNALVDAIEVEIERRGIDTMRLVSGAGHDAQELASLSPSAMIFVRGQNDGVSHSPREFSTPEDCAAGVAVLTSMVLAVAN